MFDAQSKTISSYLDWWSDAGLTEAVADAPCDWLTAPTAPKPRAETMRTAGHASADAERGSDFARSAQPTNGANRTGAMAAAGPSVQQLPDILPATLPKFDQWLASYSDLPGAQWSPARILPVGPVDAPLMIIGDCPDAEDFDKGALLSGASGRLLDAMLRAIGMDRADLRLASIALTRPPAGRIDAETAAPLRQLMLHQISLAKPQRILVLGQQTNQLLCETIIAPDGLGQQDINHFGGITAAYAVHHPRLLLERPLLKRAAWVTLKRIKDHG